MRENDKGTASPSPEAIEDENRRIRRFRFLVNLTKQRLYLEPMTRTEALEAVSELRQVSLRMFPGKGDVFDLVVAPRLERVIEERFGRGSSRGEVH